MKNIVTWIRSILFLIAFYVWTLFICLTFLITLLMPKKVVIRAAEIWAKGNRILLALFVGIKVELRGLENLPKENGYIVASKHQSAMETVLFHAFMPNTIYVMKKSLFYLPFAGWYFWRSGCIFVDRKKGTSSLRKMYATAKARLAKGFNIIIFPEGTRTTPGTKTKYNPGVAMIYEAMNVPVIPVALNTGYFWPKNSVKRHSGTVIFEFLPQIEAGLDKRQFMSVLEEHIESAVSKQTLDNAQ